MKLVLALFMLAVFAMFISVDNAEAILNLDTDTFLDQLAEETVSLAPSEFVFVRVAEAEMVSVVQMWPYGEQLSPLGGLDAQYLYEYESASSTLGGRADRAHIRSGGISRFK